MIFVGTQWTGAETSIFSIWGKNCLGITLGLLYTTMTQNHIWIPPWRHWHNLMLNTDIWYSSFVHHVEAIMGIHEKSSTSMSCRSVYGLEWARHILKYSVCSGFSPTGVTCNPNKPNGLSHPYTLGVSICHLRGDKCMFFFIFVLFVTEIFVSKQHNAASDLGLHCLSMSHKKDARLMWVNHVSASPMTWHDSNISSDCTDAE